MALPFFNAIYCLLCQFMISHLKTKICWLIPINSMEGIFELVILSLFANCVQIILVLHDITIKFGTWKWRIQDIFSKQSYNNNGNWTEWSAIWAKIIRVIWNHKYDFRPKLHCTRFNYHFITTIFKSPKYRTRSVQIFYWCSTELVWNYIHLFFFWGGGGNKSFRNKGCKICHMILFVFHFPAIRLVTLYKPWNVIRCFVFSVASSLAGKMIHLKQKILRFVNKSHQLEPTRLQGPPVISKWV